MQTHSLIKLAAGGALQALEEQWLALLDLESTTPDTMLELMPVFECLIERGHPTEAATLAWTAIEMLKDRFGAAQMLQAAGAVLLLLKDSQELRAQVTELYRQAHAQYPAFEGLIEEAGLAGKHPVRRALRTLDVCLSVEAGTFLVSRDDGSAAQAVAVDADTRRFRVRSRGREREFGPVELADHYLPVDQDDFRVLRDYRPQRLAELLEQEPARMVISILRAQGKMIDSDALEDMLCPSLIEPGRWKKWWTKARAVLRRSPHVEIEGRGPYYLTYRAVARTLEQETRGHFAKLADPQEQLAAVKAYLRECRLRKQEPQSELLTRLADDLDARARRQEARDGGTAFAFATRLVQRRVQRELGREEGEAAAVGLLASAADPTALVRNVEAEELWLPACACLEKAWPDRRAELLAELLPVAPLKACNYLAGRLAELGYPAEQFDALVQKIMADPIRYNGALLWFWDGPEQEQVRPGRLITLLTRMLNVLGELKRSDAISRNQARQITGQTRSVLGARKCERFCACLEEIEPGVASALSTQISRLDNLGRAVREDLLKLIRQRFPPSEVARTIEPWADQSVLWTTAEGLLRKQADIDELVNVKMKENARRIGEAAAHGDLSDNAEYKFALEERDLLRSRLAQMQQQIGMARVLKAKDVPTEHIGLGSRVTFRHAESGTCVEMVFLGPFEADVARHIYNYKAPLAQAVMGLSVGDQAELTVVEPAGRYEVAALENALARR